MEPSALDYSLSDVPHWEEFMEQKAEPVDLDTLKREVKKLNAQAMELKMNLHDLSEELPTNWDKIPELAQRTFDAFSRLADARRRLAGVG